MDVAVSSCAVPGKRKPPTTVLDVAAAQIGGTLREVAKKLGISYPTLIARLKVGYLDPERIPAAELDRWSDLSRIEKRVLIMPPGVPSIKSDGN